MPGSSEERRENSRSTLSLIVVSAMAFLAFALLFLAGMQRHLAMSADVFKVGERVFFAVAGLAALPLQFYFVRRR